MTRRLRPAARPFTRPLTRPLTLALIPATAVATALTVVLAGPAMAGQWVQGSLGAGDPYFPRAGNGGYQVENYDLRVRYDPDTRALVGDARIRMVATADLGSFSLDLRGLDVRAVEVGREAASFTHRKAEGELVVRPRPRPRAGEAFVVRVLYGGTTGQPVDSTGALYGWVSTPDGALVANEPEAASTWYPVNDIPSDKATYTFRVDVPEGKTAIANGDLVSQRTVKGRTTYIWRADDPMASYLSTASIGDYDITRQTGPGGLPILNAVDRDLAGADRAVTEQSLARQPEMVSFFEGIFGPYPFTSFGAIVDDDSVDYALETQTRPVYSEVADEGTVAHELAHQWYGNSVTLRTWDDIWLNEGFATYSEWLWAEHRGGATPQQQFDTAYARPASSSLWQVEVGDPGAADLFAGAVYTRGAMALQALRNAIGDEDFFAVLTAWAAENRNGNVSTRDLVALSERISGQDLDALFDTWIYSTGKPSTP